MLRAGRGRAHHRAQPPPDLVRGFAGRAVATLASASGCGLERRFDGGGRFRIAAAACSGTTLLSSTATSLAMVGLSPRPPADGARMADSRGGR